MAVIWVEDSGAQLPGEKATRSLYQLRHSLVLDVVTKAPITCLQMHFEVPYNIRETVIILIRNHRQHSKGSAKVALPLGKPSKKNLKYLTSHVSMS